MTLSPGFARFLVWLGALLVAGAWLQPNHYFPWPSFHTDAWMAMALLLLSGVVLARAGAAPLSLPWIAAVAVGAAVVPLAQHAVGLVPQLGKAMLASAYLLGLAVAITLGALAERKWPERLMDFLMLAIAIAAVLSVGIQLNQWLELDRIAVWSMGGVGNRPFANLGQPNLLGTFLLWSVLAGAWGVVRGVISARVFIALALYLLFGAALTESRTAMLNIVLLTAGIVWWRRLWSPRAVTLTALLAIAFFVFLSLFPLIHGALFGGTGEIGIRRMATDTSSGLRLEIYRQSVMAILAQPWTGYGWDQGAAAQFAMAGQARAVGSVFSYAHNLFLDLLLWSGVLVGGLLSTALIGWLGVSACRIRDARDAVLWLLLGVVFVHAMLELPLYYGYLLWPVGLMIGTLNERLGMASLRLGATHWLWMPVAGLLALTLIVADDYLKAEHNYRVMRYESLGMARQVTPLPPMRVLDHMDDVMWMGRYEPRSGMSPADLERMRNTVVMFPSLGNMYRLSKSLALNGRPDEAGTWLLRMTKVLSRENVELARHDWIGQGQSIPAMAAVPWPE